MTKILSLQQTCEAYPSQWEGLCSGKQYIYIHFRHGNLRVGLGSNISQAVDNTELVWSDGSNINSVMSTLELKEILNDKFEFPNA